MFVCLFAATQRACYNENNLCLHVDRTADSANVTNRNGGEQKKSTHRVDGSQTERDACKNSI